MYSLLKVLMNLFAGKEWRHRCRDLWIQEGRERVGWMEEVASMQVYTISGSAFSKPPVTSHLIQSKSQIPPFFSFFHMTFNLFILHS